MTALDPDRVDLLVEHARRALVGSIGARRVDVWLGKDGIAQHDGRELAAVVVRALLPLIDAPGAAERVDELHRQGTLAPALPAGPDDDW